MLSSSGPAGLCPSQITVLQHVHSTASVVIITENVKSIKFDCRLQTRCKWVLLASIASVCEAFTVTGQSCKRSSHCDNDAKVTACHTCTC